MSSTSFEITPTGTFTFGDVEAIRGWDYDPSERHGVEYVICQDSPRGNRSSTFSRESIQTIVEALQAWLDEHAPKAFEVKKVDAYTDEEREANGKLVFVNLDDYYDGDRLGIPVEALAAFGGGRVESSDGDYIQTVYDPADFHPIPEPLKVGDRVRVVEHPHGERYVGNTGTIAPATDSVFLQVRYDNSYLFGGVFPHLADELERV